MISEDAVKEVIKAISSFCFDDITSNKDNLLAFNEIESPNFFNTAYKLLNITNNDYIDYHYESNNKYYDIFVYKDEDVNTDKLYQLIVCNRYAQIFRFKQDDYDNRQLVSEFPYRSKIYSFYDQSMIVIEKETKSGCMGYNKI